MAPKQVKKRASTRKSKRYGAPTATEKEVVAALVMDHPAELAPSQVNALAKAMRRPREVVKQLVDDAKENFVSKAERYVDIHMAATEAGLSLGDAKGLEQARKGAEWALTNISMDGSRVVDRPDEGGHANKIMIGIQMGGMREPAVTVLDKS
jgi:hypothetical protein